MPTLKADRAKCIVDREANWFSFRIISDHRERTAHAAELPGRIDLTEDFKPYVVEDEFDEEIDFPTFAFPAGLPIGYAILCIYRKTGGKVFLRGCILFGPSGYIRHFSNEFEAVSFAAELAPAETNKAPRPGF